MTQILQQITEQISLIYFIRQTLVVLALFALGFMITYQITSPSWKLEHIMLLSFPVGISVFTVSGLVLLVIGIQYKVSNILMLVGILLIILGIIYIKKKNMFVYLKENRRKFIIYTLLAVFIALISVSGIISIGFSNDSMYYYSAYPHELTQYGYLWNKFDIFLTDAGQVTALINTLPFLFGFNESFGIHNFFNLNFILFFFFSAYEEAGCYFDKKKQLAFSVLPTLILLTSMPFVFVSKWILANVYFMELMFIVVVLNHRFRDDENALIIRVILMTALSFVRIEGALYVGFVALSYMMQEKTKKKDVVLMCLPAALLQGAYFTKVFTMELNAVYTFMTWQKAVVAVAFLVLVALYGLFFSEDGFLPVIREKLKLFRPVFLTFAALLFVNMVLLVYKPSLYITNIKMFALNILRNSGWGFFPAVIFVLILLMPKEKIEDKYYELFVIGFVLVSFAACFARGDGFRESLFDSGNRVFLQIVPFIVYALAYRYIRAYSENK